MQDKAEDRAKTKRESMQLNRMARMVDVVYAIVIWRLFVLLPNPTAEQLTREHIGSFLIDHIGAFLMVLIGIVVTIIYWIQNNVMFGNLQSTDSRHSILSILQLFFLFAFLVSLREGIELEPSAGTRALESVTAALVGIAGGWSWAYAVKNHRLLLPEVTEQYAYQLRDRILAEPITAIITLPCAFVGPILWEVSWLSYPLVVWLVRRRRRAKKV
ncbi:TMEM175 family protein [Thermodesulfobacteriota bacterium]